MHDSLSEVPDTSVRPQWLTLGCRDCGVPDPLAQICRPAGLQPVLPHHTLSDPGNTLQNLLVPVQRILQTSHSERCGGKNR